MIDYRKLTLADEAAYRSFEAAMLEDKKKNPFVEWWQVEDFARFVSMSDQSETKQEGQAWSPYTRYFAFVGEEIVGFVICFWELDHPDCLKLGHVGYMVAPAYRRQGIASQLLTLALEHYRQRQVSSILIVTHEDNWPCRHLVEKQGGDLLALEPLHHLGDTFCAARYRLKTERNL